MIGLGGWIGIVGPPDGASTNVAAALHGGDGVIAVVLAVLVVVRTMQRSSGSPPQ